MSADWNNFTKELNQFFYEDFDCEFGKEYYHFQFNTEDCYLKFHWSKGFNGGWFVLKYNKWYYESSLYQNNFAEKYKYMIELLNIWQQLDN